MARDAGLLGALNNSDQIMTRTTWKASLPLACSYSDGSCGAFMGPTSNTRGNPSLEDNRSRDPGRKPLRVTLFHLEMPTAPNSHIASRWRHAFHRGRRQHAFLIAPAAPSVPPPRDFVPWCISDAGLYGAGMGSSLPASEMLHNRRLVHRNGREATRERTSASQACGSTPFIFGDDETVHCLFTLAVFKLLRVQADSAAAETASATP
jgi:hypothetical protein